jgi:hypothetical protein
MSAAWGRFESISVGKIGYLNHQGQTFLVNVEHRPGTVGAFNESFWARSSTVLIQNISTLAAV